MKNSETDEIRYKYEDEILIGDIHSAVGSIPVNCKLMHDYSVDCMGD